jgi:hypothetical protein
MGRLLLLLGLLAGPAPVQAGNGQHFKLRQDTPRPQQRIAGSAQYLPQPGPSSASARARPPAAGPSPPQAEPPDTLPPRQRLGLLKQRLEGDKRINKGLIAILILYLTGLGIPFTVFVPFFFWGAGTKIGAAYYGLTPQERRMRRKRRFWLLLFTVLLYSVPATLALAFAIGTNRGFTLPGQDQVLLWMVLISVFLMPLLGVIAYLISWIRTLELINYMKQEQRELEQQLEDNGQPGGQRARAE